ncbi:MAG: branched-chain amino acid ABC transporter permease [Desulfovibrionales bacterium]
MTRDAQRFLIGFSLLVTLLAVLPLAVRNPYYLNILNVVGLNVLVVTGLNLLIGFAGHISLGHAGFFALGAYISGILTGSYGWPVWPTLVLGAGLVAGLAALIGTPTLRLKGNYLVMATLGFNIIVTVFLVQLDDITGGPSGFVGIPAVPFFGTSLDTDIEFYWLVWGTALAGLILARNLVHSRVGRALRALHDSPLAAAANGIPIESYKVRVFMLSAVYASVAGSLYAHYFGIITPKTFDIFKSVELVTMCIVGGMGSLWGGLFGAAFLTPLPQLLHFFQEYQDIFFGAVLLLILIFIPQGLVGWLEDRRRGFRGSDS